jgi:hypothetical protein
MIPIIAGIKRDDNPKVEKMIPNSEPDQFLV